MTTPRKNARDMFINASEKRTRDWNIRVIDFSNTQSNANFLSSDVFLKRKE